MTASPGEGRSLDDPSCKFLFIIMTKLGVSTPSSVRPEGVVMLRCKRVKRAARPSLLTELVLRRREQALADIFIFFIYYRKFL